MDHSKTKTRLSRLEKRAIEARAVAPLLDAMAQRIGREEALALLVQVNQNEARERGRALAETLGRNGIRELVDDVATWGRGGEWQMEVLAQTETAFAFNVTRCPYFETYRDLGLVELGVALSCCRDEPFAEGLNPRLKLTRTKTLMEGDEHCDFCYQLDAE